MPTVGRSATAVQRDSGTSRLRLCNLNYQVVVMVGKNSAQRRASCRFQPHWTVDVTGGGVMVLAFPGCRSLTGDVRYSSPLESARLPADVALSGFGFCHELYGQHGVDEITLCQWAVHERPEPIIHAQKRETIARRHDRNGRRLGGAVVGIIERRGDEALEHDIRFAGALDER